MPAPRKLLKNREYQNWDGSHKAKGRQVTKTIRQPEAGLTAWTGLGAGGEEQRAGTRHPRRIANFVPPPTCEGRS
jgi:hypothetical protein